MHAAKTDKSERLSRTLHFIRSWGKYGATSAQVQGFTGSMAVATDISELRQNGYNIECEYDGINHDGRKIFRYTFKGRKEN
jgi:hypothetical protein